MMMFLLVNLQYNTNNYYDPLSRLIDKPLRNLGRETNHLVVANSQSDEVASL